MRKHILVSESKSLCGRQVVQGDNGECGNCAKIAKSRGLVCRVEGSGTSIRDAIRIVHADKCTCDTQKSGTEVLAERSATPLIDSQATLTEREAPHRAAYRAMAGDAVYRNRDGAQGVVRDVLISGELDVSLPGGAGMVRTPAELSAGGFEVIPAAEVVEGTANGAGSADDSPMPFRTAGKHKSTSRSRARRGGAR